MGTWGLSVREAEVPWQARSVPVSLIAKATKWRQLCQPIRAKTYSSFSEMTDKNQPQLPETIPYRQQLICHGF